MSLATLATQTVTVLHPGVTTDEYNTPRPDWANASGNDYRAAVQQFSAAEATLDRDSLITDCHLFLPPEAVIGSTDRVIVGDATFEVVGEPDREDTPRGPHHYEVHLRRLVL